MKHIHMPKYSKWRADDGRLFIVLNFLYSGAGTDFKIEKIEWLNVQTETPSEQDYDIIIELIETKRLTREI